MSKRSQQLSKNITGRSSGSRGKFEKKKSLHSSSSSSSSKISEDKIEVNGSGSGKFEFKFDLPKENMDNKEIINKLESLSKDIKDIKTPKIIKRRETPVRRELITKKKKVPKGGEKIVPKKREEKIVRRKKRKSIKRNIPAEASIYEDIENILDDAFFPLYSFEPDQDFSFLKSSIKDIESKKSEGVSIQEFLIQNKADIKKIFKSGHISSGHCFESFSQSVWWTTLDINYLKKNSALNIYESVKNTEKIFYDINLKQIGVDRASLLPEEEVKEHGGSNILASEFFRRIGVIYIPNIYLIPDVNKFPQISRSELNNPQIIHNINYYIYMYISLWERIPESGDSPNKYLTDRISNHIISLIRCGMTLHRNYTLLSPGLNVYDKISDESKKRPYGIVHNCITVNRLTSTPGTPCSSFLDSLINTREYEMMENKKIAYKYINLLNCILNINLCSPDIEIYNSSDVSREIEENDVSENIMKSISSIVRDFSVTWESNVPTVQQYHAFTEQIYQSFPSKIKDESFVHIPFIELYRGSTFLKKDVNITEHIENAKENFFSLRKKFSLADKSDKSKNDFTIQEMELERTIFPSNNLGFLSSRWILREDEIFGGCSQDISPVNTNILDDYRAVPMNSYKRVTINIENNVENSDDDYIEITRLSTFKLAPLSKNDNKILKVFGNFSFDWKNKLENKKNSVIREISENMSKNASSVIKEAFYQKNYSNNVNLSNFVPPILISELENDQASIRNRLGAVFFDTTPMITKENAHYIKNTISYPPDEFQKFKKNSMKNEKNWRKKMKGFFGLPRNSNYLQSNLFPELIYNSRNSSELMDRIGSIKIFRIFSDETEENLTLDESLNRKLFFLTRSNFFSTMVKNNTRSSSFSFADRRLIYIENEISEVDIVETKAGGPYVYNSIYRYIYEKKDLYDSIDLNNHQIYDHSLSKNCISLDSLGPIDVNKYLYNDVSRGNFSSGTNLSIDVSEIEFEKVGSFNSNNVMQRDLSLFGSFNDARSRFYGEVLHQWCRDIHQRKFWITNLKLTDLFFHVKRKISKSIVTKTEHHRYARKIGNLLIFDIGCKLNLLQNFDTQTLSSFIYQNVKTDIPSRTIGQFDGENLKSPDHSFSNVPHTNEELMTDYIYMISSIFFSPELLTHYDGAHGEINNNYISVYSRIKKIPHFLLSKWVRLWAYLEDVHTTNYNIINYIRPSEYESSRKFMGKESDISYSSSSSSNSNIFLSNTDQTSDSGISNIISDNYDQADIDDVFDNIIGVVDPRHIFISNSSEDLHIDRYHNEKMIDVGNNNLVRLGLVPYVNEGILQKYKIPDDGLGLANSFMTSLFDRNLQIFINKNVAADKLNTQASVKTIDYLRRSIWNHQRLSNYIFSRKAYNFSQKDLFVYNVKVDKKQESSNYQIKIELFICHDKYTDKSDVMSDYYANYYDLLTNKKTELTRLLYNRENRIWFELEKFLVFQTDNIHTKGEKNDLLFEKLTIDDNSIKGCLIGRRIYKDLLNQSSFYGKEMDNLSKNPLSSILNRFSMLKIEKDRIIIPDNVIKQLCSFFLSVDLDYSSGTLNFINPLNPLKYSMGDKKLFAFLLRLKQINRYSIIEQCAINQMACFISRNVLLASHNFRDLVYAYNRFSELGKFIKDYGTFESMVDSTQYMNMYDLSNDVFFMIHNLNFHKEVISLDKRETKIREILIDDFVNEKLEYFINSRTKKINNSPDSNQDIIQDRLKFSQYWENRFRGINDDSLEIDDNHNIRSWTLENRVFSRKISFSIPFHGYIHIARNICDDSIYINKCIDFGKKVLLYSPSYESFAINNSDNQKKMYINNGLCGQCDTSYHSSISLPKTSDFLKWSDLSTSIPKKDQVINHNFFRVKNSRFSQSNDNSVSEYDNYSLILFGFDRDHYNFYGNFMSYHDLKFDSGHMESKDNIINPFYYQRLSFESRSKFQIKDYKTTREVKYPKPNRLEEKYYRGTRLLERIRKESRHHTSTYLSKDPEIQKTGFFPHTSTIESIKLNNDHLKSSKNEFEKIRSKENLNISSIYEKRPSVRILNGNSKLTINHVIDKIKREKIVENLNAIEIECETKLKINSHYESTSSMDDSMFIRLFKNPEFHSFMPIFFRLTSVNKKASSQIYTLFTDDQRSEIYNMYTNYNTYIENMEKNGQKIISVGIKEIEKKDYKEHPEIYDFIMTTYVGRPKLRKYSWMVDLCGSSDACSSSASDSRFKKAINEYNKEREILNILRHNYEK